ncbi:uncharacterized protein LOC142107497 [Mixophyes fleayi]|uniref:uncharacterized protein LOC142107497 n=1 Tax=Mixophyes fleayi TaxID=3061075 RepID=UPI003F4E18C4
MPEKTSDRIVKCTIAMRVPALAACIFSAVIGTAYPLQCITYLHAHKGLITADQKTILVDCSPEQDVCMMTNYTIERKRYIVNDGIQLQRGCAQSSQCNMKDSMTAAGYYIAYSTTCCNTDSCSPTPPVLPKRTLLKNGITCPACHSEKAEPCVPVRAIPCTGNETHCVLFSEKMFNVRPAYSSGCVTKTVFKDNGQKISLLSTFSRITVTEISRVHSLPEGNFLWCHTCHAEHMNSCTYQKQILCPPDNDVCLSEVRSITYEQSRKHVLQILKRCGKSSECKFQGSMTSTDKTMAIKTFCCNTDLCNTPDPTSKQLTDTQSNIAVDWII